MFKVLIADDDYEDRELLRLEIERALGGVEDGLKFFEAVSVRQAMEILRAQHFDLMTLDIEFDRMTEGIDALPDFFEAFPTLSIIIISGKLNKDEVSRELFRFTKDNVLKGARWARHFDVLDKKDDKTAAIRRAHSFTFKQKESADRVHDLILQAEAHLERGEMDRCRDIYLKIQSLAPQQREAGENIRIVGGAMFDQALEYLRRGEKLVAALLLGHYLESRLKGYTRRVLGRKVPGLGDCLKELERARRISPLKRALFQQVIRVRNKAVHHPGRIEEADFTAAEKDLALLEAHF